MVAKARSNAGTVKFLRWFIGDLKLNFSNFWYTVCGMLQVANPLLIMLFIPLFQHVVYPGLTKCGLLKKPLQRMKLGAFLAALSFAVAGVVELRLEVIFFWCVLFVRYLHVLLLKYTVNSDTFFPSPRTPWYQKLQNRVSTLSTHFHVH